jgi:hypothetical protein
MGTDFVGFDARVSIVLSISAWSLAGFAVRSRCS